MLLGAITLLAACASSDATTSTPTPITQPTTSATSTRPTAAARTPTLEHGQTAASPDPVASRQADSTPAAPLIASDLATYLRVPLDYRAAFRHYATIDRADDGTVRLLYASPEAVAAIDQGAELPATSVIVMEVYQAARNPTGGFATDADGRFVPGTLDSVAVRLQLADDAAVDVDEERVPEGIRNGAWDYATLDPVAGDLGSVNNAACHACHGLAEAWEFTFSYPRLVAAIDSGQPQYGSCGLPGRQPCELPDGE